MAAEVGKRIRERREQIDFSLNKLAAEAKVSKSYLWNLENGKAESRPSGKTLYRIAEALGTTMSDLLGQDLLSEPTPPKKIPESLKHFAAEEALTSKDVQMLAGVNFRGKRPKDPEGWALIWQAIKHGVR